MDKQLEKKLFDKFPFYEPYRPLTESLMGFGCECGDGWFQILWDLSERLSTLDLPSGFSVVQVKEKFGGLRFYTTICTQEIGEVIAEAEEKSIHTCEICGEPGTTKGRGWVRTLCDTCREGKLTQCYGVGCTNQQIEDSNYCKDHDPYETGTGWN